MSDPRRSGNPRTIMTEPRLSLSKGPSARTNGVPTGSAVYYGRLTSPCRPACITAITATSGERLAERGRRILCEAQIKSRRRFTTRPDARGPAEKWPSAAKRHPSAIDRVANLSAYQADTRSRLAPCARGGWRFSHRSPFSAGPLAPSRTKSKRSVVDYRLKKLRIGASPPAVPVRKRRRPLRLRKPARSCWDHKGSNRDPPESNWRS
jgi:hypothetical protein